MDLEKTLHRPFIMHDSGQLFNIDMLYPETPGSRLDAKALKTDPVYIAALEAMMEPMLDLPDPFGPESLAYWAKRGVVKERHGMDVPMDWDEYKAKTGYWWNAAKYNIKQNEHKLWNSYVPVSAFDPKNAGRKYPTVIAMHGAGNPLLMLEGWGYVAEASKREWIVIVPSMQLDDILMDILAEAKTLYPIDESRIYATGFSYGGWAANRLGVLRPEVFAAVAPCGMPMDSGLQKGDSEDCEPIPALDGVYRGKPGMKMPIININGELDGNRMPFYDFTNKPFGLAVMSGPADMIEGINFWARVNDAPEIELEGVMATKTRPDATEAERRVGIPAAPGCVLDTFTADNIVYHTADLVSRDGVVRVRHVAQMNIPHWPTPEMARQVMAFFAHFSRDPETKESIYTP